MSLPLHDITEGRELLARSKAGEPGARQALGAWFEAWGGMVLDAFERILAPLPNPMRRFCPECGNRSLWPHASWCSQGDGEQTASAASPADATPSATIVDEVVSWPVALKQHESVPRTPPMTPERIALLRLYQRSLALDEPNPMVPVTSTDLLALLDAAERGTRIVAALRDHAKEAMKKNSDEETSVALQCFADLIDPTSEYYDPNQDPLVSR